MTDIVANSTACPEAVGKYISEKYIKISCYHDTIAGKLRICTAESTGSSKTKERLWKPSFSSAP